MTFRSTYRAWRDAMVSSLHLIALETQTRISAIEAAQASAFETELRSTCFSEEERMYCRLIAQSVARLGVADKELLDQMTDIARRRLHGAG